MAKNAIRRGESPLIDCLMELKRINEETRPEKIEQRARDIAAQMPQYNCAIFDDAIRALCDEVDKQIENNIRAL